MARRKSSKRQRDVTTPSLGPIHSNPLRLLPLSPIVVPLPPVSRDLVLAHGVDRRLFRPDRSTAPPAAVRRSAARVVAKGPHAYSLTFSDSRLVGLCVRRKVRREVLFALRKTRKGAGAKRRRNFWSNISC